MRPLAMLAVLAVAFLPGCLSSNVNTNANQHDALSRVNDNRVGLTIEAPQLPMIDPDLDDEVAAGLIAAYREAATEWAEAMKTLKLPETLSLGSVTITNDMWWDMRGSGAAETSPKTKGEAALDAALGLGGSNVTKEGGSTKAEGDTTETTEKNTEVGGGGAEGEVGGGE